MSPSSPKMKRPLIIREMMERRDSLRIELEHHQARAIFCQNAIEHLSTTLALCGASETTPKKRRRFSLATREFPHGLVSHTLLDVLRRAATPLTVSEIKDAVHELLPRKLKRRELRRFDNTVRGALVSNAKQGILVKHKFADQPIRYEINYAHLRRQPRKLKLDPHEPGSSVVPKWGS